MQCQSDGSCVADGVQGSCESTGFCAFPDAACPSGRRYGQFAGTLSGECVDDDGGSSSTQMPSSSGEASTSSTTIASSGGESSVTSTGAADSSSAGSESSTGGVPDVPLDGLLAYYPIHEDSSRMLADVSGNGLDGVVSGIEPSFDKGQEGWVLQFDGNIERNVLLPLDVRLTTLNESSYTLAADVYYQPDLDPTIQPSTVVGRAGNNTGLTVSADREGSSACMCHWDLTDTITCTCGPIENTTWHRIVAVVDRDAGETRLFIDGFIVGLDPTPRDGPLPLDSRWYIGTSDVDPKYEFNDPMLGSIDNVLIYERALTDDEAFALSMD